MIVKALMARSKVAYNGWLMLGGVFIIHEYPSIVVHQRIFNILTVVR